MQGQWASMAKQLEEWAKAREVQSAAAAAASAPPSGAASQEDAVMEEASESLGKDDGLFHTVFNEESCRELTAETNHEDLKRKIEEMLRSGSKKQKASVV